ncbi:Protocadherin Fat 2 [Manis pentadactyla]|nr:Protocadherin Fat 2 [Manis pentadactyla]
MLTLCKAGNGQFHLSQDHCWVLSMLYDHNNGNNNNDDGVKPAPIPVELAEFCPEDSKLPLVWSLPWALPEQMSCWRYLPRVWASELYCRSAPAGHLGKVRGQLCPAEAGTLIPQWAVGLEREANPRAGTGTRKGPTWGIAEGVPDGAVASKVGQEAEPGDVTNLLHFKEDLQYWASGPASTQPSVGHRSQGQLLHMAISSHIC